MFLNELNDLFDRNKSDYCETRGKNDFRFFLLFLALNSLKCIFLAFFNVDCIPLGSDSHLKHKAGVTLSFKRVKTNNI